MNSANKDILFSDILPNLDSFQEDSVVSMMTKHLADLKKEWQKIKDQIIQLRVKTRSGEYQPLNQVLIVELGEDVSEPFKYIELSNELDPAIFDVNKELLLLISKEYEDRYKITSKRAWINEKIKEYISQFNKDESNIENIHIQFVCEVAKLTKDYEIDEELINQVQYLVSSETTNYKNANELTVSSIYSPICDFQAHGVSSLDYISNKYITDDNRDTIKEYFKNVGVHHDMKVEDLEFLTNREFSCYFWSNCFSENLSKYKQWIEEGKFNSIDCIPTGKSVKRPESLYAPSLAASFAIRAKVDQWQEKVPYKAIVDKIENKKARELFQKLNFKTALSFEDCLQYLANVRDNRDEEKSNRLLIIQWILGAQSHNTELVDHYRNHENATWKNGKGRKEHISKLFAIDPAAKQERNIFKGNEYIIQTSSFPENEEDFRKICNILKIKCLTSSDFKSTPKGEFEETDEILPILKARLLILAAIEKSEDFQEKFDQYNEKLSRYKFYKCDMIDLGYDNIHNDVMRIYNDDTRLYYVKSWLDKRTFTKFCTRLKKLIDCSLPNDVIEDILDKETSIEDSVEKYCSSLKYNNKFQEYSKSLGYNIVLEHEDIEETTDNFNYYDIAKEDSANTADAHKSTLDTPLGEIESVDDPISESTDKALHQNIKLDSKEVLSQDEQIQDEIKQSSSDSDIQLGNEDNYHDIGDVNSNDFIENDLDIQPLGDSTYNTGLNKPKSYSKEDIECLRSHSSPLELESLPATKEELDLLAQCDIKPEQIADSNYLVRLRLHQKLTSNGINPEENMKDFVNNNEEIYKIKGENNETKYIHTCSAARGVMYISPSIWEKMLDNKCEICVYLDGQGKNFYFIRTADDFLKLVEKDDVVIKITGKEKIDVVKALYSEHLKNVRGTAYTLIRVAKHTNMNEVFAHYTGAMAEPEDGNDDNNEYGE